MKRGWTLAAGGTCTALAVVLIAGVVRVQEPDPGAVLEARAAPPSELVLPDAVVPAEVQLAEASRALESDPELDGLRELASLLVQEYFDRDDVPELLAKWRESYRSEAQVIFASPGNKRFLTLTAARVNCQEIDDVLETLADPVMGTPDRCRRWTDQAARVLKDHGLDPRGARRVLREARVDTAVRIVLVYAGWVRTGSGAHDYRRVGFEVAPVYPQAHFGVARRVALDGAMRKLGVGPYSDTPIEVVTALLRW